MTLPLVLPAGCAKLIRMPLLLILSGICICSCTGSWAQSTHVLLEPVNGTLVHGDAEVSLATVCGSYCRPVGGSDVLLTLVGTKKHHLYSVSVWSGTCQRRTGKAQAVVRGSGQLLAKPTHGNVSAPLRSLTTGKYALVVRDDTDGSTVSCGVIRKEAPL